MFVYQYLGRNFAGFVRVFDKVNFQRTFQKICGSLCDEFICDSFFCLVFIAGQCGETAGNKNQTVLDIFKFDFEIFTDGNGYYILYRRAISPEYVMTNYDTLSKRYQDYAFLTMVDNMQAELSFQPNAYGESLDVLTLS